MRVQDESIVTLKQHTKPCADCPWRKTSIRGWLGSFSVDEWIDKVRGESQIECHTLKQNSTKQWQCAGAAIYRANTCKVPKDIKALRLRPNKDVFTFGEFEKHHTIFNNKTSRRTRKG